MRISSLYIHQHSKHTTLSRVCRKQLSSALYKSNIDASLERYESSTYHK